MRNYIATLSQTGTAAPSADVHQNTIGTVSLSRYSAGTYLMQCIGAFPEGKVHIMAYAGSNDYSEGTVSIGRNSDDELIIYTRTYGDGVLSDNVMGDLHLCISTF